MSRFLGANAVVLLLVSCGMDPRPDGDSVEWNEETIAERQDPVVVEERQSQIISLNEAIIDNPEPDIYSAYRIGPGDMLLVGIYGRTELYRDVLVSPDGKLSYLNLQGVAAADKTLPELRTHLEQALSHHFRYPRVILYLKELRSKSYLIYGKVIKKGS